MGHGGEWASPVSFSWVWAALRDGFGSIGESAFVPATRQANVVQVCVPIKKLAATCTAVRKTSRQCTALSGWRRLFRLGGAARHDNGEQNVSQHRADGCIGSGDDYHFGLVVAAHCGIIRARLIGQSLSPTLNPSYPTINGGLRYIYTSAAEHAFELQLLPPIQRRESDQLCFGNPDVQIYFRFFWGRYVHLARFTR